MYFGDESYFGLTPNVPCAWQHKEKSFLLPSKKSTRLTVFGLLKTDCNLKHYTTIGSMDSFKSTTYFDEFLNFNNLKERLNEVLYLIGNKYVINFY